MVTSIKRHEIYAKEKPKKSISPQKRTAKNIYKIQTKYSLTYKPALRLYQQSRTEYKKPIKKLTSNVYRIINRKIETQQNIAQGLQEIKRPKTEIRAAYFGMDESATRQKFYSVGLQITNFWSKEQADEYIRTTTARRQWEIENLNRVETMWQILYNEL